MKANIKIKLMWILCVYLELKQPYYLMNCHELLGLVGIVYVDTLQETVLVYADGIITCFVFSIPAGLQSPWAAGSTQRHDEGQLHGAAQSLVLLNCPRTSSVWDQSDLGLQSGQTTGHRNPHARHRQVQCRTYVDKILFSSYRYSHCWDLGRKQLNWWLQMF